MLDGSAGLEPLDSALLFDNKSKIVYAEKKHSAKRSSAEDPQNFGTQK